MNRLWSKEAERVFGFFVAKKLLFVPGIQPTPMVKLDLEKVIKVGLEEEPRIIEVLPAALLRFPKTFTNWEKLPEKVEEVLILIRQNAEIGPELAGVPFLAMKRWANKPLQDGRVKPVSERRVMKSFRLSPAAIGHLKMRAKEEKIPETEMLEKILLRA